MSGFFLALVPEHLLLALLLVLMLLEMARGDVGWGRLLFVLAMLAGLVASAVQLAQGFAAVVVPGEIAVDRFTLQGRIVVLACATMLGVAFPARESFKFWLLAASSVLGGLVILVSAGFAPLFLGIEMLSLPAFALMVQGCGMRSENFTTLSCRPMIAVASFQVDPGAYRPCSALL